MRRLVSVLLLSALCACVSPAGEFDMSKFNPRRSPGLHSQARDVVCLNGIWQFSPLFDKEYMTCDEFPDPTEPPSEIQEWTDVIVPGLFKERSSGFSSLRLPDGSLIPGEWHKAYRGWYRHSFEVPEGWEGRSVVLRFNGIAFYGKVFVNGKPVGEHLGPGTPFEIDVRDDVKYGAKNDLYVYVIDKRKGLDVPEGLSGYRSWSHQVWRMLPEQWEYRREAAGIWKDVFLESRGKTFIEDVFAMPSYREKEITGRVWVKNSSEDPKAYKVTLDILETNGTEVLRVGERDIAVLAGQTSFSELSNPWQDPRLWDIDQPNLYYMRAQIVDYGAEPKIVDEKLVRFGFREVWVDGAQIYLNGHVIHALGDWDTRMNLASSQIAQRPEYARAKFKSLREKANFLAPRMTGITPYNAFYDAADEVGFPIIPTGYAGMNIDPSAWDNLCREWTEYIKNRRNHPSIILWSIQNEGVRHSKSDSLYILQRRLDEIVQNLDPTRPYYHDGHARAVPEDPGAVYENGDLCGTAPISGGHYTGRSPALSGYMHEFDAWRKKKPFIYGEAGPFGYRENEYFLQQFYGEEAYGMPHDKAFDDFGGKTTKMIIGAWRSYGVSGIMALGVLQSHLGIYRHQNAEDTKLLWSDFNTPGAKPFDTHEALVNPYEPGNCRRYVGVYGDWIRKAYAPLLVTLYRDLDHNFFSGSEAEKDVYVVNDTKTDIDVKLEWTLSRMDSGKVLAKNEDDVTVTQGFPLKHAWEFGLPRVDEPTKLLLAVRATTQDGAHVANDDQELYVYPKDPAPRLRKNYYVYDSKESTADLFKKSGVKAEPLSDDTFAGDASAKVLIVGPYSADKGLEKYYSEIDRFMKNGGVVVVLNQNCSLPSTGTSNPHAISLGHPLMKGLAGSRVRFWNTDGNFVAACRITLPLNGSYVNHFRGSYLFEMFKGKGVLIGCNLLLADGYENDAEARLLFHNLLRYADRFERELRPVYFSGSQAEALKLAKADLLFTGLSLTGKSDETGKQLKLLGISDTEKTIADAPSFGSAILIVEKAAELGEKKEQVDAFVKGGGTLILLPQTDKTWAEGVFGGDIVLRGAGSLDHLFKVRHDLLSAGVGTQKSIPERLLAVKSDSGWHTNFQGYGDEPRDVYGLAWKELEKGMMIVNQLPTWRLLSARLGAEFKQPDPEEYMSAFQMVKETFADVREPTKEEKEKFHFLNLKPYMNAVISGNKRDINITEVVFRKIPFGSWVYAGIPFYVVDADTDELLGGDPGAANSAIILRGERQPMHPLSVKGIQIEAEKGVDIPGKVKRVHFLHAASWAISNIDSIKDPEHAVVTYRFHYKDGTTADAVAGNNVHIRDWWIKERNFKNDIPGGKLPGAKLAWGERMLEMPYALATMWVMSWDNPHPDKEIVSMDILSADKSVPLVFAVTFEE